MNVYTSNFAVSGRDPRAVAIARGKPWWFKGRAYDALAPTRAMLHEWRALYDAGQVDEANAGFEAAYQKILTQLDPAQVVADVGDGAILLCWEGFNVRCHRRLVAEWLEQALGIEVPELGHQRKDSLPYHLQKWKTRSKPKQTRQFSLFGSEPLLLPLKPEQLSSAHRPD
jgi:hypothetical protein